MSIEVARQVSVELRSKQDALLLLQTQLTAAKEQGFISPTARSRPGTPLGPLSPTIPVSSPSRSSPGAAVTSEADKNTIEKLRAEVDEWQRVWSEAKARITELEAQAAADIETLDDYSARLEKSDTDREAFEQALHGALALLGTSVARGSRK